MAIDFPLMWVMVLQRAGTHFIADVASAMKFQALPDEDVDNADINQLSGWKSLNRSAVTIQNRFVHNRRRCSGTAWEAAINDGRILTLSCVERSTCLLQILAFQSNIQECSPGKWPIALAVWRNQRMNSLTPPSPQPTALLHRERWT